MSLINYLWIDSWRINSYNTYILRVVNLLTNAVQIKNSQTHASCRIFFKSLHSIIDYPKMPWFSKKANLVKELEAIVKDRTLKAYLHFYLDAKTALKMNSIIMCWWSWPFWSLHSPTLNSKDYFMRQGNYAIKSLFDCDDTAKITLIEMGWPGSIGENQVWSNNDWMEDNMETVIGWRTTWKQWLDGGQHGNRRRWGTAAA